VLADRVLVTLVVLRLQLPHQALAMLYGVDRATITGYSQLALVAC
jgi:hypothetical protein